MMHPYLAALIGGVLIGLASVLLLVGLGRIAGISGILGSALVPEGQDGRSWRWLFLLGLPLGAVIVARWVAPVAPTVTSSTPLLLAGGALVGFGTRLGNGCTSGHGVCGVSRGSRRSITATLVFMATAAVTVFVMRHL